MVDYKKIIIIALETYCLAEVKLGFDSKWVNFIYYFNQLKKLFPIIYNNKKVAQKCGMT